MMILRSHWIPAFAGMTEWVEVDVFENPMPLNIPSPRRKPGSSAAARFERGAALLAPACAGMTPRSLT